MTDTVTSVSELDLPRYLGLWHEVGRLPMSQEDTHASDITAEYSLNDSGTIRVDNRCIDEDGTPAQAVAEATPVEDEPGQLRVSFLPEGLRWIPFTKADYWVLKIDDEYQTALVGTPNHKYLWLLSRTPSIDESTEQPYLDEARRQGFVLDEWIRASQSGRVVTDDMLETAD